MQTQSWMDDPQRVMERRVRNLLLNEVINVNGVLVERFSECGYRVGLPGQSKRAFTSQGRTQDTLKQEVIRYALNLLQPAAPITDMHQHVIDKALARHRGKKPR